MWCNSFIEHDGTTYPVEAKVFGNPSMFGIDGGRISKAYIYDVETGEVFWCYERGWGHRGEPPPDLLLKARRLFEETF